MAQSVNSCKHEGPVRAQCIKSQVQGRVCGACWQGGLVELASYRFYERLRLKSDVSQSQCVCLHAHAQSFLTLFPVSWNTSLLYSCSISDTGESARCQRTMGSK